MPFPTVIDDDGTGTTGTVLDKAFFDAYNAEIAARDTTAGSSNSGFSTSGTIDLALGPARQIRVLGYFGSADCIIRGMTGSAQAGDILVIRNLVASIVYLRHLANQAGDQNLSNIATSASTPLGLNGAAWYVYDGTTWNMIAHEQGAWITPVFSAANFFGGGAMTWTLAAGDVTVLRWRLQCKTLTVTFRLDSTSVGGTLDPTLQIGNAAWGGFSSVAGQSNGGGRALDTGALVPIFITAVGVVVQIQKTSLANWTASTDSTSAYGQITFEVT